MSTLLPSVEICEQARLSRDARFDGVFFTAVRSTGIYCRPVCPAPAPKAEHVEYHPTTASAEAAGFRPCLRCRPELAPGAAWRRGDGLIARALRLIDRAQPDAPTDLPVHALAERLHVSERHLRRLFQDSLGASPQQIQATRRLVDAHGRMLPQPPGPKLHSVFPVLSELGAMEADALAGSIRLPRKRAAAIIEVARALQAGLVSFEPTQSLEEFIRAWTALPGIGDWTAHYMAMRGWGHPDAFPAGDLVLRQQAARQLSEASVLTERQMLKLAEPWQPWRAYAVIHVWNAAS